MFTDFWTGAGSWQMFHPRQKAAMADRVLKFPHDFDALFNEPVNPAGYGAISVPTTIITGSKTRPATRRISEILRQNIPQCRHEVIEGADHMGPVTHPQGVANVMADHLRRFAGDRSDVNTFVV
jgi:pimeloyl-ACP methyl ester carboxylesterase